MGNDFGEMLHRLRTERGLSQQQLANRLDVTRSAVANWEAGHRLPDAAMFHHIAQVLDEDVATLLAAADDFHETPNVILVDDSPLVLEGALGVLREALPGAHIVAFSRPSEALAFFEQNPVAVAFLDIELGRTSGFDLCRELLQVRPIANVIFLTAYRDYSFAAWETGACGFLVKPLEVEEVRNQISRLRHPVMGLL